MQQLVKKTKKCQEAFELNAQKGLLLGDFQSIILAGSSSDYELTSGNYCFKNGKEYVFGCFPSDLSNVEKPNIFWGTQGNPYVFRCLAAVPVRMERWLKIIDEKLVWIEPIEPNHPDFTMIKVICMFEDETTELVDYKTVTKTMKPNN